MNKICQTNYPHGVFLFASKGMQLINKIHKNYQKALKYACSDVPSMFKTLNSNPSTLERKGLSVNEKWYKMRTFII